MEEDLSENDFVELTFDGEFENQSPIEGRVVEIDEDPDVMSTSLMIVVDEAGTNRDVVYGQGTHEGEYWSNVTVRNSPTKLGENARIRKLT